MFMGYFIKYNPKKPMEDCGYIAVFSRYIIKYPMDIFGEFVFN
jgi:hypothetical protein